MRRTIPATILTVAIFAALVAAPFAGASAPKATQDPKSIVLSNDDITVVFEGKKPLLHVSQTGAAADAGAASAYTLHFDQMVEYRDVNGDGAVGDNEIVARLDLTDASAWTTNLTSDAANGTATVNFTITAPVKPQQTPNGVLDNVTSLLPQQRDAKLSLLFTVHASSATLGVLALPRDAVDAQLVVAQWPFVDAANDRLALDARATGNATRAVSGGVGSLALATNGTQTGLVAWAATAHGTTTGNTAIDVPVRDVEQADANGTTRLTLTYDAPNVATIQHDAGLSLASAVIQPLGLNTVLGASSTKASPGAGVVLTVGAIAAVAALVAARRK